MHLDACVVSDYVFTAQVIIGLTMLERLSFRLQVAIKSLSGKGRLTGEYAKV